MAAARAWLRSLVFALLAAHRLDIVEWELRMLGRSDSARADPLLAPAPPIAPHRPAAPFAPAPESSSGSLPKMLMPSAPGIGAHQSRPTGRATKFGISGQRQWARQRECFCISSLCSRTRLDCTIPYRMAATAAQMPMKQIRPVARLCGARWRGAGMGLNRRRDGRSRVHAMLAMYAQRWMIRTNGTSGRENRGGTV